MPSYPDAPPPQPTAPQGPKPLHQMSFMELRELAKAGRPGDAQSQSLRAEIQRRWAAAGGASSGFDSPESFFTQKLGQETVEFAQKDAQRVQAGQTAATPSAPVTTPGRDALTKFMNDMLNTGLSPNDPIYQGLAQLGRGVGRAQASAGGFNSDSGYARYMTQNQQRNSVLPYMQSRLQMGGQASQALANLEQGDARLGEQARQFDATHALNLQGFQNDVAKQNFAAEQGRNATIGSAIGAGLAAIPGVIAAPFTGGASLGLIGAGAAAGGAIGGSATRAPTMQAPSLNGFKSPWA